MKNKLVPVIIARPNQKGWGYRSRDGLIALTALALWALVIAKLIVFFILNDATLEHLYGSIMLKLVLAGFAVTFLTFHCWALYNRYLYTGHLKRQLHHDQQLTSDVHEETRSQTESETTLQAQEKSGAPAQAVN